MASSASSSVGGAGGIGATVLAMVSQLRSTPPGPDRDAAIEQLCTASNVPVDFVNMAIAMPEQRLRKVAKAVDDVATAMGSGGSGGGGDGKRKAAAKGTPKELAGLARVPPQAIVTLVTEFKELPAKQRRALLQRVPEPVRPAVVACQFVPPEQLASIAAQVPDLVQAAQTVASGPTPKPSGATAGAGAGAGGGTDGSDATQWRAKRVEAAVKLHAVFTALPKRARTELTYLAPPAVRPAVELAEGLGERDMARIIDEIDSRSGSSGSQATPSRRANVSNSSTQGAGAGAGAGSGAGAAPSPADDAKKQAKAAAVMVARAEARRLWRWVKGDPCGLRVLNFLASLCLIFAGVTGILIQTFNRFRFFMIVLEFYIAACGLVLAALEVESALCAKYIAAAVQRWAGFLTTTIGRGQFLLFVGFTSLSIWDPVTHGWTEIVNIGVGFFVLILAIINMIVGCCARRKLGAAAQRVASLHDLERRFEEADVAMHGYLAPDDVMKLLNDLNPPARLTEAEMRSAVLRLDTDHDGRISLPELRDWWASAHTAGTHMPVTVDGKPTTQPNAAGAGAGVGAGAGASAGGGGAGGGGTDGQRAAKSKWLLVTHGPVSLRLFTFIGAVFYAVAGVIGFFVELFAVSGQAGNSGVFVLHTILDVYIVALGLLVAALEARLTTCGVSFPVRISHNARFFNRVAGRGLFYQFMGFLALSQWNLAEVTNIVSGFVMLALGTLNLVVGVITAMQVAGLGSLSRDDAMAKFDAADVNHDGVLDSYEFAAVVADLGLKLNRAQMEAAFVEVDVDGSGRVSRSEFLLWAAGDAANAVAEQRAEEGRPVGGVSARTPFVGSAAGVSANPLLAAHEPSAPPGPV